MTDIANASLGVDSGPVLVTGATGMVGRAVLAWLQAEGYTQLHAAVREASVALPIAVDVHGGLSLESPGGWRLALQGVRTVVHAAARVHMMQDNAHDALAEFRRVNVDGSMQLARQAIDAGVRRFIFVSSIKVNGDATPTGRPFTEAQVARPVDAYGISKFEAENALRILAAQCGMELVVIRPPLVYGPGVKANFLGLMRWIHRGLPLPFGAIDNRRSLVGLDNLASLIATCVRHPSAADHTFLAADGEALSTPELARRLGRAIGRPARLLPVPPSWLKAAAALAGRAPTAQRICSSLEVDNSKARLLLGWNAPVPVDEGLIRTAAAYLALSRPTRN